MTTFQAPTTCGKCGENMEEGLAVDNTKVVPEGYPAFGKNVTLGGSASWWKIVPAEPNTRAGPLGDKFTADKILSGEKKQIFTYRAVFVVILKPMRLILNNGQSVEMSRIRC